LGTPPVPSSSIMVPQPLVGPSLDPAGGLHQLGDQAHHGPDDDLLLLRREVLHRGCSGGGDGLRHRLRARGDGGR
jgi:hypothetical protein